jgi:hypothetical protein
LSWPDYERQFGGLDSRSLLGYAVYSFFANGGRDAYIVRMVSNNAAVAHVNISGILNLTAMSPGEWGNHYRIETEIRSDDPTRFRLRVHYFNNVNDDDSLGVVVESFENISMNRNDRRYVVNVINGDSNIIIAAPIGNPDPNVPPANTASPIPRMVDGNDGTVLLPGGDNFDPIPVQTDPPTGVHLLDRVDLFNLLCVPGEVRPATLSLLEAFSRDHRAFLIVDCAENATLDDFIPDDPGDSPLNGLTGEDGINAAFYFPWLQMPDPLQENRPRNAPPCGFIAGIYSRTDASRGVFKAPAGIDASLTGVLGVKQPPPPLTDDENGILNQMAVNCIRNFPVYGTVVWGARTLRGNDQIGSEWKYIPVRRTALFIEESLYRGTKWVVFEPNDEPLWAQIRLNIGAFMHNLFRQGAFQGKTPQEAYFVKCDKETTTQSDINLGIVNIIVGFAPLKLAEFVVIKIQQMAGQIQT